MAEPPILKSALDEAGQVRHRAHLTVKIVDVPDIGVQRCERIVGNLRPRRRDRVEERGFAGIWVADEAAVGD